MKKQPRLTPVFVALCVFLASGPFPAAAQVIGRVQIGAGSGSVPVVPAFGGVLPSAGALSTTLTPMGLNGSLAAPSFAPTPLVSVVPGAALSAPQALTVVTQRAAATAENAIIVRTPGAAATHIADEAAAYAELPSAMTPSAQAAKIEAAPAKGLAGRVLDTLLRRSAASISFDGAREKSAPIFGAMSLKEQKPLTLPNGTLADEQPTIPSPDREPTTRVEAYGLPGARDVGGIFETSRKVLSADPANTTAVVDAVKAMIDADTARYGVPSSDLRLIHAQRFEGKGEQADTLFVYFRQTKAGLVVNGSALSFTIKMLDGRPTIVAQTGQIFPQIEANTETVLTDDQIMGKIAERTGMPASDVSTAFEFFEQKLIYSRGAWRNVKLYVADGLPFMVAVDVVTGLVFAWDNRTGLESFQAPVAPNGGAAGVSGTVHGKTVDKGPILPGSVLTEIPLAFLEVKIAGKSYVTDKDGKFSSEAKIEAGPEGLTLDATLSGPYVRVEDASGKTLTIKVTIKPGDNQIVFNPASGVADENTIAQVNAFKTVNRALNFLRERKLTNAKMDAVQLPVRSNIDDECNAYYTPGRPSENFFRSSKNCVNSAYDSVSQHETGHFWDDFTGGIVNGGLSEGWGDILSMFDLNNPIIGEHFLKVARAGVDYIRHGENKYQYNEFDEVHDQGQAWGGFAWKLRKALIEKLGYDDGAAMAESLIMPTMFAKATTIPDAMAQVLVNATKKDGTILHEAEIRAAAQAHGVKLPQAAAPTSSPASWLKVSVKSSSIESLPGANTGLLPESAEAILPEHQEGAKGAQGVVTFTAGRLVRADALSYIRGYLDHFGVTYTIRRISGGGNGATYELAMTGNVRAIENITKTLKDGHLGY